MDLDLPIECLMGFSDDECEMNEDSQQPSQPVCNESLDLLTSFLKDSPPPPVRRKVAKKSRPAASAGEKEEGQAELLARMKQMEKELAELRKQVKPEGKQVNAERKQVKPVAKQVRPVVKQVKPVGKQIKLEAGGLKEVEARATKVSTRKRLHSHVESDTVAAKSSLDRDLSSAIISQRNEDKKAGVVTEKYSGLRLKNPKISSEEMKRRMQDYKMVQIKSLVSRKKAGSNIDGNWVTIGVLVDKLPPRDTVKGKKYTIWKLSDLSGQSAVVSLFLFGSAFQEFWKMSLGTIIALRNPNIMPDKENGGQSKQSSVAVSIDSSSALLVMGDSQDYTLCKGTTKGGKRCSNFASIADGGYCDYHVRSAYDRSRSKRMECQQGYGPSTRKGTLKEKLFQGSKTDIYYYGGQTFTAPSKSSASTSAGDSSKSSRLFAPKTSEIFSKMLQGQSAGAKMLTQHQKLKEEKKAIGSKTVARVSPSELLREDSRSLPLLGRDFKAGQRLNLVSPPTRNSPTLAKQRAIRVLQSKGAVGLATSSATGKTEKIAKRVRESRGEERVKESDSAGGEGGGREEEMGTPAERKRAKLDRDEVEALINAKSSHDWINQEAEVAREEEYFDRLEKKEAIETKKNSVMELTVSVVQCKQCRYTAEFPGKLCSKENHPLTRRKALKRGFCCRGCNQKTLTYDCRMPVKPCSKCSGTDFVPASIYAERKGPSLPTEELLLRGIEEKFMK